MTYVQQKRIEILDFYKRMLAKVEAGQQTKANWTKDQLVNLIDLQQKEIDRDGSND